MRIVLARHGRPAWDFATPIPGHAFAEWRRGEDDAAIDPALRPSAELEALAQGARVITSSLRRSIESARLVIPSVAPLTDARFREAELPTGIRSGMRLRPETWGWLFRSAWLCGWSAGVESFTAARARARGAAGVLTAEARAHDIVVLLGHGFFNLLIAKRLRGIGWRGPRFPSTRYWGFGVYTSPR